MNCCCFRNKGHDNVTQSTVILVKIRLPEEEKLSTIFEKSVSIHPNPVENISTPSIPDNPLSNISIRTIQIVGKAERLKTELKNEKRMIEKGYLD
tara:strand:- start:1331 stop:1615 length:285 start_codon:yes stop_codon:yes gene_type:complete